MTVRDAVQSILALSGVQSVCTCQDGSLGQAALTSLNRAMQDVWVSPNARHWCLEPLSVSFATAAPTDLPATVQTVVGKVQWQGYRPLPLAASASDFNNYFLDHNDEAFDGELWDDLQLATQHTVGLPWYTVEFYLPLWDDRAILIYFDNSANINALDPEAATSPRLNPLNSRTVLVRVELPHATTSIAVARDAVLSALARFAGEFLTAVARPAVEKIRVYRRRRADTSDWTAAVTGGLSLSVIRGPRIPAVAWAEELKASTGDDLARVRLHLLPAAAGTVTCQVINEPPAYILTDLDCDGDGSDSTVIGLAHQYAESVVMPLARLFFAQDYPVYVTPQAAASMPALQEAAAGARSAMGMTAPTAPQNMQRNQTTSHAHA